MTYYNGAGFEVLLTDLYEFCQDVEETIVSIENMKRKIRESECCFSAPEDLIEIFDDILPVLKDFKEDVIRLRRELPQRVEKRHFEIIDQIIYRYELECERFREFIKDFYSYGIRQDEDHYETARLIISSTREVIYTHLGWRVVLGSLSKRLRTFEGASAWERKKPKGKAMLKFPVAEGIGWNKIKIHFPSAEAIQLWAGEKSEVFSFSNFGIVDQRKTTIFTITKPGLVLLALARRNGRLRGNDQWLDPSIRKNLSKNVQLLNDFLSDIFQIRERRPIKYNSHENCWKAQFNICLGEGTEDEIDQMVENMRSKERGQMPTYKDPRKLRGDLKKRLEREGLNIHPKK